MSKVYDAEVIRQRLNTPMARRVVFSLLVKRPDMDRTVQEQGVDRTVALFMDRGMLTNAAQLLDWWKLSERDELTLDHIHFCEPLSIDYTI